MPLRSLTPLGKQLRSALAHLRPPLSTAAPSAHAPIPARLEPTDEIERTPAAELSLPSHPSTFADRTSPVDSNGPNAHRPFVAEPAVETRPREAVDTQSERRKLNRRRINRRTRVNRITEALQSAGHVHVTPLSVPGKIDRSHWRHGRHDAVDEHHVNAKRHEDDFIPVLAKTTEMSLEKVLAGYIQHSAARSDPSPAAPSSPFRLPQHEADLLQSKGFTISDVQAWAEMVSSPDSVRSAKVLTEHLSSRGPRSVPLFVLLNILRRPYISPGALRIVIQQTGIILADRASRLDLGDVPENAVFLLFNRLLRHAREVWPGALEGVTALLLLHLPEVMARRGELVMSQLETLTYMLNKAMRLISIPTAVEPFKGNRFQEAAIVRVLRFMTEHDPPLQTNREGYRAVIRMQLAQRKTPRERQWADLKALSWPPWKQERTAMDSDITAEEHGLSKAGETLLRMREAGYAPSKWEQVASIYAGWDSDGTPTIQTLALFETSDHSVRTGTAAWAARIATTRTAQEAWACYLAYEDSKLPPSQDVYLSIFEKLQSEEMRVALDGKKRPEKLTHEWMQSGDSREVEPLPPSTHLYTYTRTPPPSMDELYRKLRDQGVEFQDECLAFLVRHARSLPLGLEYLWNAVPKHPQLHRLLHQDLSWHLTEIPTSIFVAFIKLLSRFSNVPISEALPRYFQDTEPFITSMRILNNKRLNVNHPIVRAIELLKQRRPFYPPAWNAVLKALARSDSFSKLSSVLMVEKRHSELLSEDENNAMSAILAYKLMRVTVGLMKSCHLELGPAGLHALCLVVENTAIGCLQIFRHCFESDFAYPPWHVSEAYSTMRSWHETKPLRVAFDELVGDVDAGVGGDASQNPVADALELPQHLGIPGPALLHSYVRALGWMAEYEGLLEVVRWMVRNQVELHDRCETDWRGAISMRKILRALRVFLERSWLTQESLRHANLDEGHLNKMQMQLKRLESPAPAAVIEEIQTLVDGVEHWGGWPDDEELRDYCRQRRFEQFA